PEPHLPGWVIRNRRAWSKSPSRTAFRLPAGRAHRRAFRVGALIQIDQRLAVVRFPLIEGQDRRAVALADDPSVLLEKPISEVEAILVQPIGIVRYRDEGILSRVVVKG